MLLFSILFLCGLALSANVSLLTKPKTLVQVIDERVDSLPAFDAFMDRLGQHVIEMGVPVSRPDIHSIIVSKGANDSGQFTINRSSNLAGDEECQTVEISDIEAGWMIQVTWSVDLLMRGSYLAGLVQYQGWMRLFHFRAKEVNSYLLLDEMKSQSSVLKQ